MFQYQDVGQDVCFYWVQHLTVFSKNILNKRDPEMLNLLIVEKEDDLSISGTTLEPSMKIRTRLQVLGQRLTNKYVNKELNR
jgi:DNA polymerase III sliding clamp (beta) subunit (PCNA family)